MQIQHRSVFGRGLCVAILVVAGAAVEIASAADHPTLVDPEKTTCETCHDEILAVRIPHPPAVDDCLTCHAFDQGEETTIVGLVDTGSALCLACHDGMVKAAEGKVAVPHAPVIDDCGTCHDPHGTDFDALLVVDPGQVCGQCHDADATDALHPIPVRRADCRSCHDTHGSENEHMLRGVSRHLPFAEGSCEACHRKPRGTRVRLLHEGGALCEACHGGVATKNGAVVHTAVKQGRCVECHDPHLAEQPLLLKAGGGDLCFSCHPEIAERAKGPGGHAALEDGCDGCHDAHSSDRPAMLLDDEDELCRACHDASDPELRRLHFGAEMATARCGSCHDPHGSSSLPLIANGSIHPPFREGCSNCHEGSAPNLVDGGGNALCENCHEEVSETIATAAVPHPAMAALECVDCHSPHASRQPKLLRAAGGGLCLDCHEDQAGGEGDTVHRAISWIGCHSCHLPHGGPERNLLRATGNDLCNGCHLQSRVKAGRDESIRLEGGYVLRGERAKDLKVIDLDPGLRKNHPIPEHPVSGVIAAKGRTQVAKSLVGQEMSCRQCHEPHAAPSPQLFTWKAENQAELCIACHPK
jgi:predicted CXXCH cytochrome family protein